MRSAWKRAQSRVNSFWKRWSQEYLVLLHQRPKWQTTHEDLRVGELVLLVDGQRPRNEWKLGRVAEVGGDATHARKATVRVSGGTFLERDRTKLVRLELDGDSSASH